MEKFKEWEKTCLNKSRMSEGYADALIKKVKTEKGITLRKYFCPHCFGWHVTRKSKNEHTNI